MLVFKNHRMATVLVAVAIFLLFPTRHAQSDTPPPRVQLGPWAANLKVGPNMNANGKSLRGSEFVGQDLDRAVFDGCDLSGVHFWDCGLRGASFKGAHLTGVFIDECGEGLAEADFTDAMVAGLRVDSVAYLSPHQLMTTRSYKIKNLRGCVISAYDDANPNAKPVFDFRGAHLEGARLSDGDFCDCDFTDAYIDRIEIVGCKMTFKQLASTRNFKNRDLTHMNFSGILVGNPDFSGIDLTGTGIVCGANGAEFRDAIVRQCTIRGTFTKDNLYSTKNYQQGDLSRIKFENIDMSGWNLSCQNLTDCGFWGCNLSGARLDNAVITGMCVSSGLAAGTGLTIEQIRSTWNYKNGRMAGVVLPKGLAEALQKERGSEKKGAN